MSNVLNEARDYLFEKEDLIKYFDVDKITKKPIYYELDKLRILNKEYLKNDIKEKLKKESEGIENFR